MHRFFLPLLAILSIPAAAHAGFQPNPQKKTLANGARVIVLEVPDSEVVSVQVWYHVGSKNEVKGQRGLAHMFEHMMFKGTRNIGPEEHSRRVQDAGGRVNAFTTEDVTVYYQTLPVDQLDLALKLEADRMKNLLLTTKTFETEREVVKEEKRTRVDNNPIGMTVQELWANAYTTHPYEWTAIGTEEDLNASDVNTAKAFYKKWYIPNNATIVVVGGIDKAKVFGATEKYFGKIPKGPEPNRALPKEPEQVEARDVEVRRPAQLPVLVGGYHIPPRAHADIPVLEVLGLILSGGDSSRMYQSLVVNQNLALGAGGFTWDKEDPSLFAIYAIHLPNIPSKQVRGALLKEVEQVVQHGVTDRELKKAKNQLTAQYIFGLDTAEGLANQLGSAEVLEGGMRRFLEGPKKYEKITTADIKRVARKYLKRSNLTLVMLVPEAPKK